MTTPAHTDFDSANPQASQTPTNGMSSSLSDLRALRDMIIAGLVTGFALSIYTQGTGPDANRPQYIGWYNATAGIGFRWNISWSGFQIVSIIEEWTNDSQVSWTAMTTSSLTYDGNNNVTGMTTSSGFVSVLLMTWTKTIKVVSDFAAHIAATGTAVHGLGTMAIQNAVSVLIAGGSIDGVNIGDSTRARGSFSRIVENVDTQTPALNAGVTLNLAAFGGTFVTTNGTNAVTFGTVPSGLESHLLIVDNLNNITVPGTVSWGLGGKPSIAGLTAVVLWTYNAGANWQASIMWRAV